MCHIQDYCWTDNTCNTVENLSSKNIITNTNRRSSNVSYYYLLRLWSKVQEDLLCDRSRVFTKCINLLPQKLRKNREWWYIYSFLYIHSMFSSFVFVYRYLFFFVFSLSNLFSKIFKINPFHILPFLFLEPVRACFTVPIKFFLFTI